MSATDGSAAAAALVAELSFSFQDELTATIHNAFGVAVEIAVLEVTKLVGQALRDVRDQMHETLRENRALQQRLHAAELELSVARGRDADREGEKEKKEEIEEKEQQRELGLNPVGVESIATSLDCRDQYGFAGGDRPAEKDSRSNRSFCEIREDGQVCSHDLSPDLERKSAAKSEHGGVTGAFAAGHTPTSKGNQSCVYSNSLVETQTVCFDQGCAGSPAGLEALIKTPSMPDVDLQSAKVEQPVKVKEESSDMGCTVASAPFVGSGDDFGPDCLSLAQSKLLEDWRPEPLHLQSCVAEPLIPCTSHSLSDSPVFNPELPDLNMHSPSSSGLHPPFSKPFLSDESISRPMYGAQMSNAAVSVPNVTVPNSVAVHTCKVCGESFHLMEELRQHRSQHHGPKPPKHPKRQAFPPGRSPYHCSLCGRDFNRMEHLKIHQRIHTGERPYACSVCSARFRHSWALTRHFRIHTGEKPYACSLCGKTFRNCGGLRFHQRSHSLEGNS
ncbi:zinc finger protein Gfi-1b-like [Arapaima gigas]